MPTPTDETGDATIENAAVVTNSEVKDGHSEPSETGKYKIYIKKFSCKILSLCKFYFMIIYHNHKMHQLESYSQLLN